MKRWNDWKQQNWFPYTVAAVVGVCLYMFLNNIAVFGDAVYWVWIIVKPLLYGLILAYLIDPIARFYQDKPFSKLKKKKIARSLSVIFALITVLIVVAAIIAAFVPTLIKSISNVLNVIAEDMSNIDEITEHIASVLPLGLGKFFTNASASAQLLEKMSTLLTNNMDTIADASATFGNGFANLIIAIVLAIYYMMDKDRLKDMMQHLLRFVFKDKGYNNVCDFLLRVDAILLRYIKCNLLEAAIVGVINAIFMVIAGLPYVTLVSIIVGITNIAPTFGPVVGAAIGALFLVIVNPWYALAFLIFTVVLQTLDGYIIKPKLFGETLGVSPLLVLIMIIVGGRVFGVVGILLAIPFAAIAQFLFDDLVKKHNAKKSSEKS